MNRVAFIIAYFGKLPNYFGTFLQSIADKPFDLIFLSDCPVPASVPSNFKYFTYTFDQAKQRFNEKLGIEVGFKTAYKLCDLKPTLGYVFNDYIQGYEFWGSIDTDLMVGNFSKFLSDDLLDKIDFYSGIKGYVSGSFFVVRNNDRCNTLFMKSKDWQTCFRNPEYVGFDECGGHYFEQLRSGKSFDELNIPIESFSEVVVKEMQSGLRAEFKDVLLEPNGPDNVRVENNGVFYRGKEYLLVHFIYFKSTYYFYTKGVYQAPFFINNLGFFQSEQTGNRRIFSVNFVNAVRNKIRINLRKLGIDKK